MEDELEGEELEELDCEGMNDQEEGELEYKSRNEPEEAIGRPWDRLQPPILDKPVYVLISFHLTLIIHFQRLFIATFEGASILQNPFNVYDWLCG